MIQEKNNAKLSPGLAQAEPFEALDQPGEHSVLEVKVASLVEFINEAAAPGLDLICESIIFRGQAKEWNLLPGIVRKCPTRNTTAEEKGVLEQLKLQGASFLNGVGTTDLDFLVLAQHSGLKTRLLDWTSNPLAALWFACSDAEKGDVFVYALVADGLLDEDVYASDPFSIAERGVRDQTCVFQPRLNNARIIAQHGWFTLHRPGENGMFVPLEQDPLTEKCLHKFRIPAAARSQMLVSLGQLGVNAKTIFPDLDGLCRHLNWKHQLV